ncbi:MAG TPA: ABC transporter transmembrane domain-containing protein, partial [candidate division Zixibacteria bacterium]|nr:ABC transporter transmembrane domain-containing protein [candidate division Zixibacteria bacterium]
MSERPQSLYLRTLAFIRPYWGRLFAASTSAMLYSFLSALMIWMIGPLLMTLFNLSSMQLSGADQGAALETVAPEAVGALTAFKESLKAAVNGLVQGDSNADTLLNFCLLVLIVVILKNGFNYLQGYLMAFATQGMMRDVRNRLFDKYQDLSFEHFHMERTGSLMSRITNDANVLNVTLDLGFNRLVADISLIVMLVAILLLLSVKLTLMATVALPASLVFIYFIGNKIRKYSGRSQERMADVTTMLEENISNFRIVKAFGTEEKEKRKFHSATQSYFSSVVRMIRIGHLSSPVNDTLATIAGLAMLLFAGATVLSGGGGMDAADFLVFIVAMFSLIKPAKSLSTTYARIQEGMAAA